MTPMKDMIRKKHAVAALRINNFLVSNWQPLTRRKKKYFRFARMRQNANRRDARRSETVKRSTLIVTVGSELRVILD